MPVLSPAVAAAQEQLRELRARLAESRGGTTAAAAAARPAPPAPAPPPDWAEIARRGLHSQALAEHLRAAGWAGARGQVLPGSRDALQQGPRPEAPPSAWHLPKCLALSGDAAPPPVASSGSRDALQQGPRPEAPPSAWHFPKCLALSGDAAPPPVASSGSRDALRQGPRPEDGGRVAVQPDIALAILRAKRAAPGRVWLLLRHADAAGRGAIDERTAARLLSGPDAPLRVCGRRQLSNLLAAGDGLFWQRTAGVLWLRSAVRVAAALGVARLSGAPVAVPVAALTGSIGRVRAHLYASFHSGRQRTDLLTGAPRPRGPIARSTLTTLSAAAPNSQRAYERRAGVRRRSAVAIGPPVGAVDEHEVAWQRGRALFHLRDRQGRFGCPGAVYLAWQLPNEYTGPHATLPRGRQKRLNRALADLFLDGMTGNGEPSGAATGRPRRCFYGSAKSAALARHDDERYWRGRGGEWYWQAAGGH